MEATVELTPEVAEAIEALRAFVLVHVMMYCGLDYDGDDPYMKHVRTVRAWLHQLRATQRIGTRVVSHSLGQAERQARLLVGI